MKSDETKDWHDIINKVDRLLDRFETFLEMTSLPICTDSSLFERHIAFRWEKRMGKGFLQNFFGIGIAIQGNGF